MEDFWGELIDMGLGFLETEDIWLGFVKPFKEAFFLGGADTVYVPGDEGQSFGHVGTVAEGWEVW